MPRVDYQQAIEFINSVTTAQNRQLPLKRMAHLLDRIDHPEHGMRVIHVAGTSGKGSVAAFVAEILHAAGMRVGLSASPYLQVPIERMRVGKQYISPQELAEEVAALKPAVEEMLREAPFGQLRSFELWIALTLRYFRRQQVDYAVIEVGAGGRYSCTNVVEPAVAVIVTVDFDHTKLLGHTIPAIAHHKAGIIKPGVPAVTAEPKRAALEVIERECLAQGSSLARLGREFQVEVHRQDRSGARFDYLGAKTYRDLEIRLLGPHQVRNAATAVAAIEALEARAGARFSEAAIREGLQAAFLPGRLEIVQSSPTVVLDGAHNAQKIRALAGSLELLFAQRRVILVLGLLKAKDAALVMQELAPVVDLLVATAPKTLRRSAHSPQEIARLARAAGLQVVVRPDPQEALDTALAAAGADDVVCVTGSLYLVGQVRGRWVSPDGF